MKKFIAIYGGTNLDDKPREFVSLLAQAILQRPETVIVTGGFERLRDQLLSECEAVVADVTETNCNVMYELGCAHAKGIEPLLFSRQMFSDEQVPFYLREYKLEAYDADDEQARGQLIARIQTYMKERS